MPVIMKMTPVGRRAEYLSYEDAEAMVSSGTAIKDQVHHGIYVEVTKEEISQGYMTRDMQALPVIKPVKPNRKQQPEAVDGK